MIYIAVRLGPPFQTALYHIYNQAAGPQPSVGTQAAATQKE
jgi:hypothetical protein